jgi:hypothetical protein
MMADSEGGLRVLGRVVTFQPADDVRRELQAAVDAGMKVGDVLNAAMRRYGKAEGRRLARRQIQRSEEYLRRST